MDMRLGTYPDHEYDPWGEPAYKHVTPNIRLPLRMVDGFSNYAEVLNFIDKLKKRGYRDTDVRKILGGNYLRVFSKVWK